ncbi:M20/M25/M40 family metallo-hydrolase [Sphingomonas sp. MMS24-J13]|uniref:M20/M25/M40 family metallo-hydrolase n=1 Tax=Sphingomonas sp. MMS24-J13 TaxID=3238686 RepID=UPI00384CF52A
MKRALLLLVALSSPAFAALTAPEAKMVATIDAERDRDFTLLRKLVDQNSGTRNLAGVRAVADMMKAELEPLGFTVRWVDMEAKTQRAGHLLAEHKGDGKGRHILLIGHMDTVFEKDSPFQKLVRRGDTVEGPGVDDMKGGLVVMVAALRAMKQAGTLEYADIRIVLSGDEESAGTPVDLARADMVEAGKWADAAMEYESLATEDGKDVGSISRRGSISWVVTATGRTAHSAGVFGEGVGFGANYELARIVDTFRRELREPNLTYNIGLMLGGVEVAPTTAEVIAGTASGKPNIVAAKAIATGDIRALSNEQARRIEEEMRAIVGKNLPGTKAEITFRESYPAMAPTEGSRALLKDLNAANADLGLPAMAELDPMKRGAGDIAFVAPYVSGLVGTGIVGAGAHAAGETADLSSIPRQAKRSALLMSRWSRMSRSK